MTDRYNVRQPFDIAILADLNSDPVTRDAEWNRLFMSMTPRLRDYFHSRVEDGDALDELLAEIWRRALLGIGKLHAADALWSWLVTIGTNLLRDQGRTRSRRDGAIGRPIEISQLEEGGLLVARLAGDVVAEEDTIDAIQALREHLSDEDWDLLNLWAVDEMTHPEIAARLGLPSAEASRQRVSRLRRKLRKLIATRRKEAP